MRWTKLSFSTKDAWTWDSRSIEWSTTWWGLKTTCWLEHTTWVPTKGLSIFIRPILSALGSSFDERTGGISSTTRSIKKFQALWLTSVRNTTWIISSPRWRLKRILQSRSGGLGVTTKPWSLWRTTHKFKSRTKPRLKLIAKLHWWTNLRILKSLLIKRLWETTLFSTSGIACTIGARLWRKGTRPTWSRLRISTAKTRYCWASDLRWWVKTK